MKKLIFVFAIAFCSMSYWAQGQSFRGLDKSPLDCTYLPDHFAHDRQGDDEAIIKIIYSRPAKRNREIFGQLIPYGKVWRTGANEAAEIKFYKNVTLGGKKIKAGTYSLYTIPGEKEWTLIISNELDYWGSYRYDAKNDVARIPAKVMQQDQTVENFSIQFFDETDHSATLKLAWDQTVIAVPVEF